MGKFQRHFIQLITLNSTLLTLLSCSVQKKIARSADETVLKAAALQTAHVGISIYEPATGKYWFNYQGDKYFVPASNTKIPTCYAAMKYLGDSLVGLKYGYSDSTNSSNMVLGIQPTGDPSLLHPDFKHQPVWDFLRQNAEKYKESIAILDTIWKDERWGSGWSWTDYDASYMAERNVMPIFGNVIDIKLNSPDKRGIEDTLNVAGTVGIKLFKTQSSYFDHMVNANSYLVLPQNLLAKQPMVTIRREMSSNTFWIDDAEDRFSNVSIPFITGTNGSPWYSSSVMTLKILSDSLKMRFGTLQPRASSSFTYLCPDCRASKIVINKWYKIHSQPTDSLLKPMMHRSDNFFAEQTLLMVSNERLGIMSDRRIIDTLLKTDFRDLPQKPRWADGSGLSRYNLFTPQDFVAILNKMKNEFGMDRIKVILPTGGEGTFSNYYKTENGYLFAKTGTLSGVVAISGFLYTKKNKLLIFSILVNNHNTSATDIRRAVEKFLQDVRGKY